jgi:hypothetical protein
MDHQGFFSMGGINEEFKDVNDYHHVTLFIIFYLCLFRFHFVGVFRGY